MPLKDDMKRVNTHVWSVSLAARARTKYNTQKRYFLQEDEVDRLATLLDEEGDGRVSYRSLLGMLVKHLGDWSKRLPEVRMHSAAETRLLVAP